MKYVDGTDIQAGDVVSINGSHRGKVIASMDTGQYLTGQESWGYLGHGVMVDTDFGGLVHYTSSATDMLALIERPDVAGRGGIHDDATSC